MKPLTINKTKMVSIISDTDGLKSSPEGFKELWLVPKYGLGVSKINLQFSN